MEYENLVASLLRTTARLFYDPPHCVVLDLLLDKLILYDFELTHSLKMLSKEFHKIVVKLKEDKLIKIENKIENIDGRQNVKTIYYLDFCQIKDTIKYKVYKMTKLFETQKKELYACKTCHKEFSLIEIQSLVVDYKFICDECCDELAEKIENEENVDLHKLMMTEIQVLVDILRKLDSHDIKNMDYFQILKIREEREKKSDVKSEGISGDVQKSEEKIEENNDVNNIFDDGVADNYDANKHEFMFDVNTNHKQKNHNVENEILEYVTVAGKKVLYHNVTAEDEDKMSAEEYEKYYEIYENSKKK